MTDIIDRNSLLAQIERHDVTLLEILPQRYFELGHLPGAKLLAPDSVESRIVELAPDKQANLVVYCASDTCQNSHTAARQLKRLGYQHVRVYAGGKKDWEEAGLSLER